MAGGHLLTILTFLPALGALGLLLLRGEDHEWIRRLALAVSVAAFLGFWDVAGTVILGHPPRRGPASQYVVGAE